MMLSEINFKYMENSQEAEHNDILFVTDSMSRNPIDLIFKNEFVMGEFNAVVIKNYLD